ncbi:hypothetical protein Rleg4DRAFT_7161 [Rhizobium leguminosarum bv. trifolii WSM2297]|uniref:Uncharacterized protein n=1 Tax=Rhizobium leguminosarum bv. trifolii WSM2297 TaxID=754762 RepID=J0CN48_RHILT|nr:hypothetical protein Rleg4DRAFT_7161 [Rhizobium leguminosarum bv. trifolii WSM2297]
MTVLVLVVDDEADVEVLFRQQFRRDLRARRLRRCHAIFRLSLPSTFPQAVLTMTCRFAGATSQ